MANLSLLLHIILLVLSIVLGSESRSRNSAARSDIPLRAGPVGPGAPQEDAHIVGYYVLAAMIGAGESLGNQWGKAKGHNQVD
jgi:hypothetical protein